MKLYEVMGSLYFLSWNWKEKNQLEMNKLLLILLTLAMLLLASCAANKPYLRKNSTSDASESLNPNNIDYEVFMVGNIGATTNNVETVSYTHLTLPTKA